MRQRLDKKIIVKNIFGNLILIVLILLFKASVFANYHVPTGSMNPTILEGDKIFTNNIACSIRVPFTKLHLAR